MVEGDQQQGLDQLALDGGAFHGDDGLLREDGRALFNGPHVAVEGEVAQIVQELFVEHVSAAQILNVRLGEGQVVNGLDELGQAGHDGIAAAVRHLAEEHIEDTDLVLIALFQVAGRHGQLIKVHHGRQVAFYVQHCCTSFLLFCGAEWAA